MKKPGMVHPPKKKHQTKPRSAPVVRLSREQQLSKASDEYGKSHAHLAEAARAGASGGLPIATVHLGYYAMHHAAVAALLVAGGADKYGDVPQSHQHVAAHFARVAGAAGIRANGLGQMLARAMSDRMVADYGLGVSVTDEVAKQVADEAAIFVRRCEEIWPLGT